MLAKRRHEMKRYKKVIVSIIFILILIILTPFVAFLIDNNNIIHGKKPVFCSKYDALLDGGTVVCQYQGYQIIKRQQFRVKGKYEVRIYPNYFTLK